MTATPDLTPELPGGTPLATDERTTLVAMLDYHRAVLARKASGLDASQLTATLAPSDLTLGSLLFHMALVEDSWFHIRFAGNEPLEPWASADWEADPDWELHHAHLLTPDQLFAQFSESIERSRAVVAAAELDQLSVVREGDRRPACNLRWILVHMIEEYARHCGHADFLRQSIDGVTGD